MLTTKYKIGINDGFYDLEIYQLDKGVITAFKFDGRIFLDDGKTKQAEQKDLKEEILEVPYISWTGKEEELLRKVYPNMTPRQIIESGLIKRSEDAIYKRACVLGLKRFKTKKTKPKVVSVSKNISEKTVNIPKEKICNVCGETKSINEFSIREANHVDGRQNTCRDCSSKYSKKRRAKELNIEQEIVTVQKPVNIEQIRQKSEEISPAQKQIEHNQKSVISEKTLQKNEQMGQTPKQMGQESEQTDVDDKDLGKRFTQHKQKVIDDLRKRRMAYEHKTVKKDEILEETA